MASVTASHHDLAYIYIDVVDEDGNLCPTAELPLKVETSGTKHIATCGTGHPYDMKSFRTLTPKSFRGKAVIIIQPQDETGEITIKVTSPNLKSAEYKLQITKCFYEEEQNYISIVEHIHDAHVKYIAS